MRAALGGHEVVSSDVVNLFLAFFHAADVVLQRYILGFFTGVGRGKTQQTGNFFAVAEVFRRAFF